MTCGCILADSATGDIINYPNFPISFASQPVITLPRHLLTNCPVSVVVLTASPPPLSFLLSSASPPRVPQIPHLSANCSPSVRPPISWAMCVCEQQFNHSEGAEEGRAIRRRHSEDSPSDHCCLEAAGQSHHQPSTLENNNTLLTSCCRLHRIRADLVANMLISSYVYILKCCQGLSPTDCHNCHNPEGCETCPLLLTHPPGGCAELASKLRWPAPTSSSLVMFKNVNVHLKHQKLCRQAAGVSTPHQTP